MKIRKWKTDYRQPQVQYSTVPVAAPGMGTRHVPPFRELLSLALNKHFFSLFERGCSKDLVCHVGDDAILVLS